MKCSPIAKNPYRDGGRRPDVEGDIETAARHIYSLLGWCYTTNLVPVQVSNISDPGAG